MTGIHTSTGFCVVLKIAPGGAVNALCVSGQHMTMNVDVGCRMNLLCARACWGVPPLGHDLVQ